MNIYQEESVKIVKSLFAIKIIPVLALETVADGVKICELLSHYGLLSAEITFRTKAAPEVIKEVSRQFPVLTVGAGTILNVGDLHKAFDAGAKFAVAPGFNPTVMKEAVKCGYAFSPGICTPSELEQAYVYCRRQGQGAGTLADIPQKEKRGYVKLRMNG